MSTWGFDRVTDLETRPTGLTVHPIECRASPPDLRLLSTWTLGPRLLDVAQFWD